MSIPATMPVNNSLQEKEIMEPSTSIIPLTKGTSSYKIKIPSDVENKIIYLCNKISQIEWSGILFYSYSGSFEDGSLEIVCKDIYLMDIGISTYTDFFMSPEVMSYMVDNDLLDYQLGLVHSHCVMSTFFSSTDLNTLREEGNDRNIFVSLIVNNAGTYTAAVTRKITCTKTISREYSYEFFGEGSKESKDTQVIQSTEIEWFNLTIDKESSSRGFEDVNIRITELQKRKVNTSDNCTFSANQSQRSIPFNWEDREPIVTSSNKEEKTKGGVKETKEKRKTSPFEDADDVYELMMNEPVDEDLLDSLVLQILTGCVFISKGIDRDKWIKSMEKVYSRRFDNYLDFSNWAEFFIDFLMEDLIDKDKRLIERGFNRDEVQAIYACHLSNALLDFEENIYIKEFQENLERYYLE